MAGASLVIHVFRLASIALIPLAIVALSGAIVQTAYVSEESYRLVSLVSTETGVGYSVAEIRVPAEIVVKPPPGVLVESIIDPFTGLEAKVDPGSPVWVPGGFYYIRTRPLSASVGQISFVADMEPAPRLADTALQAAAGVLSLAFSLALWRMGGRLAWRMQ